MTNAIPQALVIKNTLSPVLACQLHAA